MIWVLVITVQRKSPKTYDMLTPAEKLAILDRHVLQVMLDASKAYRVGADMDISRQSAIDAEENEKVTT